MSASEPGKLALTGLHHVTAIARDLDRTAALYCDVLA